MTTNLEATIVTAKLGHPFTPEQLKTQCRTIIGGVAWPGKHPGFGLVLAVAGGKCGRPYEFHLLDEAESGDLFELIPKCDVMDSKYTPERWIGDDRKKAAETIMGELHAARQPKSRHEDPVRTFYSVCRNALVDDEGFYEYAIPLLKSLLREDDRRLFLKTSHVRDYMGQVKEEELPFMRRGDCPAIEALGYAVLEASRWVDDDKESKEYGRRRDNRPPSAMSC